MNSLLGLCFLTVLFVEYTNQSFVKLSPELSYDWHVKGGAATISLKFETPQSWVALGFKPVTRSDEDDNELTDWYLVYPSGDGEVTIEDRHTTPKILIPVLDAESDGCSDISCNNIRSSSISKDSQNWRIVTFSRDVSTSDSQGDIDMVGPLEVFWAMGPFSPDVSLSEVFLLPHKRCFASTTVAAFPYLGNPFRGDWEVGNVADEMIDDECTDDPWGWVEASGRDCNNIQHSGEWSCEAINTAVFGYEVRVWQLCPLFCGRCFDTDGGHMGDDDDDDDDNADHSGGIDAVDDQATYDETDELTDNTGEHGLDQADTSVVIPVEDDVKTDFVVDNTDEGGIDGGDQIFDETDEVGSPSPSHDDVNSDSPVPVTDEVLTDLVADNTDQGSDDDDDDDDDDDKPLDCPQDWLDVDITYADSADCTNIVSRLAVSPSHPELCIVSRSTAASICRNILGCIAYVPISVLVHGEVLTEKWVMDHGIETSVFLASYIRTEGEVGSKSGKSVHQEQGNLSRYQLQHHNVMKLGIQQAPHNGMSVRGCVADVPDSDPCSESPCRNGGVCKPKSGQQVECECQPGWEGERCTHLKCTEAGWITQPSGATSRDTSTFSFPCETSLASTQDWCIVPLTEAYSTCIDSESCYSIEGIGSYDDVLGWWMTNAAILNYETYEVAILTTLNPNTIGATSDTLCAPDEANGNCVHSMCHNGGTCYDEPTTNSGAKCNCSPDFIGMWCDIPAANDICGTAEAPACQNDGGCIMASLDAAVCVCSEPFYGDLCQFERLVCKSDWMEVEFPKPNYIPCEESIADKWCIRWASDAWTACLDHVRCGGVAEIDESHPEIKAWWDEWAANNANAINGIPVILIGSQDFIPDAHMLSRKNMAIQLHNYLKMKSQGLPIGGPDDDDDKNPIPGSEIGKEEIFTLGNINNLGGNTMSVTACVPDPSQVCSSRFCGKHGECQLAGADISCKCDDGWEGVMCDQRSRSISCVRGCTDTSNSRSTCNYVEGPSGELTCSEWCDSLLGCVGYSQSDTGCAVLFEPDYYDDFYYGLVVGDANYTISDTPWDKPCTASAADNCDCDNTSETCQVDWVDLEWKCECIAGFMRSEEDGPCDTKIFDDEPSDLTWLQAAQRCADDDKRLCSYREYCPTEGKPYAIVGGRNDFAPIGDEPGMWIGINDNGFQCQKKPTQARNLLLQGDATITTSWRCCDSIDVCHDDHQECDEDGTVTCSAGVEYGQADVSAVLTLKPDDYTCDCKPGRFGRYCESDYVRNPEVFTWTAASAYCSSNNQRLCYLTEICTDGSPMYTANTPPLFHVAIADSENDWAEVRAGTTCERIPGKIPSLFTPKPAPSNEPAYFRCCATDVEPEVIETCAENEKKCQFPFSYEGITYYSCSKAGAATPWCPTDPFPDEGPREFSRGMTRANCIQSCPAELVTPSQCLTQNVALLDQKCLALVGYLVDYNLAGLTEEQIQAIEAALETFTLEEISRVACTCVVALTSLLQNDETCPPFVSSVVCHTLEFFTGTHCRICPKVFPADLPTEAEIQEIEPLLCKPCNPDASTCSLGYTTNGEGETKVVTSIADNVICDCTDATKLGATCDIDDPCQGDSGCDVTGTLTNGDGELFCTPVVSSDNPDVLDVSCRCKPGYGGATCADPDGCTIPFIFREEGTPAEIASGESTTTTCKVISCEAGKLTVDDGECPVQVDTSRRLWNPPDYCGHCKIEDPCFDANGDNVCQNDGRCSKTETEGNEIGWTFQCTCLSGWEGTNCETEIDQGCQQLLNCNDHGQCKTEGSGDTLTYFCECDTHWFGTTCNSRCPDTACGDNGSCRAYRTSESSGLLGLGRIWTEAENPLTGNWYECNCRADWYGWECQFPDPCAAETCNGNGICQTTYNETIGNSDTSVEYTCDCFNAHTGPACDVLDPCKNSPCVNGQCEPAENVATIDDFVCTCNAKWFGERCDKVCPTATEVTANPDIDVCNTQETNNRCYRKPDGNAGCLCTSAWVGDDCKTAYVDPCTDLCASSGICVRSRAESGAIIASCNCNEFYSGDKCDTFTPCDHVECQHGGTCKPTDTAFECECVDHYNGPLCARACPATNTCSEKGRCVEQPRNADFGHYKCFCNTGYTGRDCEIAPEDTANHPCFVDGEDKCLNQGICSVNDVTYQNAEYVVSSTCKCRQPYSGDRCQYIDPCFKNECRNGGTCSPDGDIAAIEHPDQFNCACHAGWHGRLCTEKCPDGACNVATGKGHCLENANDVWGDAFTCQCTAGNVVGADCQQTDPCKTNNGGCQNSGVCTLEADTNTREMKVKCGCVNGYSGDTCETFSGCSASPCMNGATCTDGADNQYTCDCSATTYATVAGVAYVYAGVHCDDPCADVATRCGGDSSISCIREPHPNANGAKPNFYCDCPAGKAGFNCELNSPCFIGANKTPLCQNGGTCKVSYKNGVPEASCKCVTGFTGSSCQSVRPCPGPANARYCPQGICADLPRDGDGKQTVNSATGSPFTCTCGLSALTNVLWRGDRCDSLCTASFNCNNGACKTDLVKEKPYCQCNDGYVGTFCTAKDPCLTYTACKNGGKCVWIEDPVTRAVSPTCSCIGQYGGATCDTFDVCASKPCGRGTCKAVGIGFQCVCEAGWYGERCVSVCPENACHGNGVCGPTLDAAVLNDPTAKRKYACRCNSGKVGADCEADDPCQPTTCTSLTAGTCSWGYNSEGIIKSSCECSPGRDGESCQNFDRCNAAINACNQNGGTGNTCERTEDGASFACTCAEGYFGDNCRGRCPTGGSDRTACNGAADANCVSSARPLTTAGKTNFFKCICPKAGTFFGIACSSTDLCASKPCGGVGVGKCVQTFDSAAWADVAVCICNQGYSGENCETADPCKVEANPCGKFGQCTVVGGSRSCTCAAAYDAKIGVFPSGHKIQWLKADTADAASPCTNPCGGNNGLGICSTEGTESCTADTVGFAYSNGQFPYKCNCKEGFAGDICDQTDDCTPEFCSNGGTCTYDDLFDLASQGRVTKKTCICPPGYYGNKCNRFMPCGAGNRPSLCQNGATCTELVGDYSCACAKGTGGEDIWFGKECASRCKDNYCQNGGSCSDKLRNGTPTCTCPSGWAGDKCEVPDTCTADFCSNSGTCKMQFIQAQWQPYCECPVVDGVQYTGAKCNGRNLCALQPCTKGNTERGGCRATQTADDQPDFSCICKPGWHGKTCDSRCPEDACRNGGTCIEGAGQWRTEVGGVTVARPYHCECTSDWSGDYCEFPNPCKMDDGSSPCVGTWPNGDAIVCGWKYATDYNSIFGKCECPPGKGGRFCRATNPCRDADFPGCGNGKCSFAQDLNDDNAVKATCTCEAGWYDKSVMVNDAPETRNCATQCKPDARTSLCNGNGVCQDGNGRRSQNTYCICDNSGTIGQEQWAGDFCSEVSPCYDSNNYKCKNGGRCQWAYQQEPSNQVIFAGCTECDFGWGGNTCEDEDLCNVATPPCGKHGVCSIDSAATAGIKCACETGFTGDFCEIVDQQCAAAPIDMQAALVGNLDATPSINDIRDASNAVDGNPATYYRAGPANEQRKPKKFITTYGWQLNICMIVIRLKTHWYQDFDPLKDNILSLRVLGKANGEVVIINPKYSEFGKYELGASGVITIQAVDEFVFVDRIEIESWGTLAIVDVDIYLTNYQVTQNKNIKLRSLDNTQTTGKFHIQQTDINNTIKVNKNENTVQEAQATSKFHKQSSTSSDQSPSLNGGAMGVSGGLIMMAAVVVVAVALIATSRRRSGRGSSTTTGGTTKECHQQHCQPEKGALTATKNKAIRSPPRFAGPSLANEDVPQNWAGGNGQNMTNK